jgi:hypothetical protein
MDKLGVTASQMLNLPIFGQPPGVGTEGMLPVKRLLFNQTDSKDVLSPMFDGMVPEKALFMRYNLINPVRLKKLEGIVPFR